MNVFAALLGKPAFQPSYVGTGQVHKLDDEEEVAPPKPIRTHAEGERAIDRVLAMLREAPAHNREVTERLEISRHCASAYLSLLCAQGFIRRCGTTKGPSGHALVVYEAIDAEGTPRSGGGGRVPKTPKQIIKANRGIDAVYAQVRKGPTTFQEAAKSIGMQPGSVSFYLTLLLRQGYIKKVGKSKSGVVRQRTTSVYAAIVPGPDGPPASFSS